MSEINNVFYRLGLSVLIAGLCAIRVLYIIRPLEKIIKQRGEEVKAGWLMLKIAKKV